MNVEQLIAALSKFPPKMPVFAEDGVGHFGPAVVVRAKVETFEKKTMFGSYYSLRDDDAESPVDGEAVISGVLVGCDPDKKLSA